MGGVCSNKPNVIELDYNSVRNNNGENNIDLYGCNINNLSGELNANIIDCNHTENNQIVKNEIRENKLNEKDSYYSSAEIYMERNSNASKLNFNLNNY